MRIAIEYSAAINQLAGIGRFVRGLVNAIAEIDHQNEYVLLHAAPNPGRAVTLPPGPNFTARRLPFRERTLTILWHRLRLPLPADRLTGPVDIFHAPDFILPPVQRAVTLLTVHDLAFLVYPECAHEKLRRFLEGAVPRSVARADYVLTDSENTRNDVVCLLDVNPERVFVVPGGVDPIFAPASEQDIQRVCHFYEIRQPYVLAVGTIEPRKNYPRLMEAYARFRTRTGLPHQLVLAGGRGWLSEDTFRSAERSPYREDIRFTGHVPDEELAALYSGAEVFAYPSLYEGFGLPVLEAMACGAPVVCSDTSSLPECAEGAALLVSPNDPEAIAEAVESVCGNDQVRQELQRQGRERARQYQWAHSAERLLAIYEQVAQAV